MSNLLPSTPQLALLVAMGIMIFVLWRRSNKHFGRGGTAYETPARVSKLNDNRDLALSDAPPEISRWQVEMYELSRELKGEIDTKLALLQILIRQANEAAQRLERANQQPTRQADALTALENWQPDVSSAAPAQLPEARQVYALADRGLSASTISEQTGLSLGDVEMTLSLRRQG